MSLPISMLNGLTGRSLTGFGAVVTDLVTLGGKTYAVDQLLDKVLVANGPIKVYNKPGGIVLYTVGAGQSVGKIYSYNRPSATNGGQFWLEFDHPTDKWPNGVPKAVYITSDNYVSTQALETQGALTLEDQAKAEAEQKAKQTDPVGYYLKKYGLPVLLIGGGIYLAATFGKAFITAKLSK